MRSRPRLYGLTLLEVLFLVVVLAVTVSLVIIVFPRRPRSIAFRMTCGTNLSGLGKAMQIYANDYENQFPRAGGPAVTVV